MCIRVNAKLMHERQEEVSIVQQFITCAHRVLMIMKKRSESDEKRRGFYRREQNLRV